MDVTRYHYLEVGAEQVKTTFSNSYMTQVISKYSPTKHEENICWKSISHLQAHKY